MTSTEQLAELDREYVGRTGMYAAPTRTGKMLVPVTVIAARSGFGRVDLQIQVAGTNDKRWVKLSSVKLEKVRTP